MRFILIFLFLLGSQAFSSVDCGGPSVVTADDSTELDYFKRLYDTGASATLEEYLHLWYPNEADYDGAWFFDCQSRPFGPLDKILRTSRDNLGDKCKPDVLYSWGPEAKLDTMARTLKDNEAWSGDPNPRGKYINNVFFMAMTPAGSFAYGPHLLRVKIKRGVPFLEGDSVSGVLRPEVRFLSSFYQDFSLTDASVIEAWSYGTPELYDELVRDVRRLISQKRAQLYATLYSDLSDRRNIAQMFGERIDSYEASEDVLKQRFRSLLGLILNNQGRIFYQQGVCRNRRGFFSTGQRTYFNPL